MRLAPAIIIAFAIVLASLIGVMGTMVLTSGGGGDAVDRELRIEFEEVRFEIDGLKSQVTALEAEIASLRAAAQAPVAPQPDGGLLDIPQGDDNLIRDSYAQVVSVAGRKALNSRWTVPTPSYLVGLLGQPAQQLLPTDGCLTIDNPDFSARLVEADVGPIRVKMLQPAIDSLTEVFERIKSVDVDLYNRIKSAGAICARPIRGTIDRWSSHSFGTALDLNIDGKTDDLGDGLTQLGLTIMAEFFEEEGWIWGAGFKEREDSMHFEVSKEKLEQWRAEGKL